MTDILDIGAHCGEWARRQKAPVFMIEANYFCEPYLYQTGLPYLIAVLGKDDFQAVNFYLNKNDLLSTGSSYYKELSQHFTDESSLVIPRLTRALDKLFPNSVFEFIKMDTQGSELDIMRGGEQLVKRARQLLIETSVLPYNQGAPLEGDVVDYLNSIGFEVESVSLECRRPELNIHQNNVLFRNVKKGTSP